MYVVVEAVERREAEERIHSSPHNQSLSVNDLYVYSIILHHDLEPRFQRLAVPTHDCLTFRTPQHVRRPRANEYIGDFCKLLKSRAPPCSEGGRMILERSAGAEWQNGRQNAGRTWQNSPINL